MDLQVTEYEYHKYVFSPLHNIGMKYGKCEVVTIERLLLDHKANKENRTKLRLFAHQIADVKEGKGKRFALGQTIIVDLDELAKKHIL